MQPAPGREASGLARGNVHPLGGVEIEPGFKLERVRGGGDGCANEWRAAVEPELRGGRLTKTTTPADATAECRKTTLAHHELIRATQAGRGVCWQPGSAAPGVHRSGIAHRCMNTNRPLPGIWSRAPSSHHPGAQVLKLLGGILKFS